MNCFIKGEGFQGYLNLESYMAEKASYDLTDDQRAELQSIIDDIENRLAHGENADFSKAYDYLKGTIPAGNPDANGLNWWLNVAVAPIAADKPAVSGAM